MLRSLDSRFAPWLRYWNENDMITSYHYMMITFGHILLPWTSSRFYTMNIVMIYYHGCIVLEFLKFCKDLLQHVRSIMTSSKWQPFSVMLSRSLNKFKIYFNSQNESNASENSTFSLSLANFWDKCIKSCPQEFWGSTKEKERN